MGLGIDALWLSPVYPSPMADFGYDVADYRDVDPLFGSLAGLDRGVDGFRMDVIHAIGKDPALPDLPPDLAPIPMCALIDDPSTHPLVAGIRAVVKERRPDAVIIGETVLPTVAQVARFYGTGAAPELDLAFNFHPLHARWDAGVWRQQIDQVVAEIAPAGWPAWALGNHDNPRQRTRYGSAARARAAAVLLLTQMGTPFLYAGEELGLSDAVVPADRKVDPGGRDGCRAPIPWSAVERGGSGVGGGGVGVGGVGVVGVGVGVGGELVGGWAGEPWLPWPPEAATGQDAAAQAADPESTLHLYRRLLAARRGSPALAYGRFDWVPAPAGVLAYRREGDGDERVVGVNFSAAAADWVLPEGAWAIEVGTYSGTEEPAGVPGGPVRLRLRLRPDEAVVLRPVSVKD